MLDNKIVKIIIKIFAALLIAIGVIGFFLDDITSSILSSSKKENFKLPFK